MRAMPSPTDSTRPTSATSPSRPKFLIWSRSIAETSAAWIAMLPDLFHHALELAELRADRGVDHARAEPDDEPADQRRVHPGLEPHGLAGRLGKRVHEA